MGVDRGVAFEFKVNKTVRSSWLKGAWAGRGASGQGRVKSVMMGSLGAIFFFAGVVAFLLGDDIDIRITGGSAVIVGIALLAFPKVMEKLTIARRGIFERLWYCDGYLWLILRTAVLPYFTLGALGKMSAWRINLSAVNVSWNISERRLEFEGDVVRWTHPYRAARTFDPRDPGVTLPERGQGTAAIYPYWEPDLVALVQRYAPIRNVEYMNVNR